MRKSEAIRQLLEGCRKINGAIRSISHQARWLPQERVDAYGILFALHRAIEDEICAVADKSDQADEVYIAQELQRIAPDLSDWQYGQIFDLILSGGRSTNYRSEAGMDNRQNEKQHDIRRCACGRMSLARAQQHHINSHTAEKCRDQKHLDQDVR